MSTHPAFDKAEDLKAAPGIAAPSGKEQNHLLDDYFMTIAFLVSLRSKDPRTQVGACIVDAEKRIVGVGYNGMPFGCSDEEFPWTKGNTKMDRKKLYVCHSEMNAITNANCANVRGCTMYVLLFPCTDCAHLIAHSRIAEVVYVSKKHHDRAEYVDADTILQAAGVTFRQYHPPVEQVVIKFPVGAKV